MTKSNGLCFVTAAFITAFTLGLFASAPSRAEINCAGGQCNCSGDKDCNTMFTSLCKDTGGSCNNDNNTCTCPQKEKVSGGTTTMKPGIFKGAKPAKKAP